VPADSRVTFDRDFSKYAILDHFLADGIRIHASDQQLSTMVK